jgi:hypothetical protein
VEYKIRLDPLVRRQLLGWKLPDGVLVDIHIRLHDHLARSPISLLRDDSGWFDNEGLVYGFEMIDPEDRMLVHYFRFQVFYHADEQSLLVTRGAHLAAEDL